MRFIEEAKHLGKIVLGVAVVATAILFFAFSRGGITYFFPANNPAASSTQFGTDGVSQETKPSTKRLPARNWDILDASSTAEGVLIQSLDENFPFFRYHTRTQWPAASLTKLLTAVVVLEEYGDTKKIPITMRAVESLGFAGGVSSGEVYLSGDLLKIMLLTSSNDAATAFEDFAGGREEFNWKLNRKAAEIGMTGTLLNDASGLSDLNVTTADDMLLLTKYIYERHPEILNWTRLNNYLVQPVNTTESRNVQNIHPFAEDKLFLGGKTGTSEVARQNMVSIFSFKDFRIAVIILGSPDRVTETRNLMRWIEGAYGF